MPLPCAFKGVLRRSPGTPREQLAELSLTLGGGASCRQSRGSGTRPASHPSGRDRGGACRAS